MVVVITTLATGIVHLHPSRERSVRRFAAKIREFISLAMHFKGWSNKYAYGSIWRYRQKQFHFCSSNLNKVQFSPWMLHSPKYVFLDSFATSQFTSCSCRKQNRPGGKENCGIWYRKFVCSEVGCHLLWDICGELDDTLFGLLLFINLYKRGAVQGNTEGHWMALWAAPGYHFPIWKYWCLS